MTDIEHAQTLCAEALEELRTRVFEPHCRLTLIVRNPLVEDGDMVVTADDLAAVEATVVAMRTKEDEEVDGG